jgi:hypothetical protein
MTRGCLAVLVAALGGCDAILGIESFERAPETPPEVGTDCDRCVERACSEPLRACVAESGCARHQRCIAACAPNDARCRLGCETASPVSVASGAFPDLDRCVRTSCVEECVGLTSLAPIFEDDCACLDTVCREAMIDCIRSGPCEHTMMCIAANGVDPNSISQCGNDWPTAQDAVNRVRNCYAGTTECRTCRVAGGANYECVWKYRWIGPDKSTVRIKLHVTTFDAKQTPIANASVRACGFDTCDRCETAEPAAVGTTDANGDATLELKVAVAGFGGCFDIRADGYAPTLFSAGRAIARDIVIPMYLVRSEALAAFPALLGTTPVAGRGTMLTLSADCFHALAPGVQVELVEGDDRTRRGYFVGNTLDTLPTGATGRAGATVFVNVPTGYVQLESSYQKSPVGQLRFLSREGILSIAVLYPRIAD